MAKRAVRNQGKTEFVRELLKQNPLANTTAAKAAWTAAGREGSLSATLVNKQRAALGLAGNLRAKNKPKADAAPMTKLPYTGKKRGRKPKSMAFEAAMHAQEHVNGSKNGASTNGGLSSARSTGRIGSLEDMEADLDRLLFKVMGFGGLTKVEESIRHTRRLLYGALVGK